MPKRVLLSCLPAMVGVLLLTAIAYKHSLAVSAMYDQRMRADIQECARQLTQAGLASAQVQALQSMLNEVNHNTLSLVTSEVGSVIGIVAFMGIIITTVVLRSAASLAKENNQTKQ
jgi:hypothetical protein